MGDLIAAVLFGLAIWLFLNAVVPGGLFHG